MLTLRLHPALAALFVTLATSPSQAPSQTSSQPREPVLVELFTSEGCSSCPPADRLLSELERQQPVPTANIIVLEEHVDYWDRQGWHDRFSSSQFTERQNGYAPRLKFDDPYTPQMVVDGSVQLLGSDPQKALTTITKASQASKIPLTLAAPTTDGRHIACSVSAASGSNLPKGDLYAVVVQPTASTEVKSGENGGHHLDHVNVVRSMQRIGKIQDLGSGPVKFNLNVPSSTEANDLNIVVFAQTSNQGPIEGVAAISTAH
jgi:hypothetical protein